jgi:hypothetical protein
MALVSFFLSKWHYRDFNAVVFFRLTHNRLVKGTTLDKPILMPLHFKTALRGDLIKCSRGSSLLRFIYAVVVFLCRLFTLMSHKRLYGFGVLVGFKKHIGKRVP